MSPGRKQQQNKETSDHTRFPSKRKAKINNFAYGNRIALTALML